MDWLFHGENGCPAAGSRKVVVDGAMHRGDLLVTSARAGYAMKGTDASKMTGAILGKALQPLESGDGTIEVLVTLH